MVEVWGVRVWGGVVVGVAHQFYIELQAVEHYLLGEHQGRSSHQDW